MPAAHRPIITYIEREQRKQQNRAESDKLRAILGAATRGGVADDEVKGKIDDLDSSEQSGDSSDDDDETENFGARSQAKSMEEGDQIGDQIMGDEDDDDDESSEDEYEQNARGRAATDGL